MKFKAAKTIQVGDILEVTRSTKRGYFFKVSRICHLKQCIEFADSTGGYFLHTICKKVDPSNEREIALVTRIIELQNKENEAKITAFKEVRERVVFRLNAFKTGYDKSVYAPTRDAYTNKASDCQQIIRIIDRKIKEYTNE
jgi:hypothetical protein